MVVVIVLTVGVDGLGSRPNLLNLSPGEFEHLVRQLFMVMGAVAWTTIALKDGGVDAVAPRVIASSAVGSLR
jgi:hypothetical protein